MIKTNRISNPCVCDKLRTATVDHATKPHRINYTATQQICLTCGFEFGAKNERKMNPRRASPNFMTSVFIIASTYYILHKPLDLLLVQHSGK